MSNCYANIAYFKNEPVTIKNDYNYNYSSKQTDAHYGDFAIMQ